MLFGIDVSKWQAQPDWQAVKDSGVAYAIAKATEGWGYIDPEFRRNWSEIPACRHSRPRRLPLRSP